MENKTTPDQEKYLIASKIRATHVNGVTFGCQFMILNDVQGRESYVLEVSLPGRRLPEYHWWEEKRTPTVVGSYREGTKYLPFLNLPVAQRPRGTFSDVELRLTADGRLLVAEITVYGLNLFGG